MREFENGVLILDIGWTVGNYLNCYMNSEDDMKKIILDEKKLNGKSLIYGLIICRIYDDGKSGLLIKRYSALHKKFPEISELESQIIPESPLKPIDLKRENVTIDYLEGELNTKILK